MAWSTMLGNSEVAQLLAPAGNPYPYKSHPAQQAHTNDQVEDYCGNGDEHDGNHIQHDGEPSGGRPLSSTDDDEDDHSNDHNDDYDDGNQPPASTNGTYSESLTRLQNGYLHAISVLEDRNKALQDELDDLRARKDNDNVQLKRRLAYEEQENKRLEAELRAARLWPHTHKKTQRDLELTLAKKNETIKEKNSKINEAEARNMKLEQELKSEKKINKKLSATIEVQDKAHLASKRSNGVIGGTMNLPIRESRSTVKTEDTTLYPATKKRKHEHSLRGGSDNPVVLD